MNEMTEEDIKFQSYLAMMAQRRALRARIIDSINEFNQFNNYAFPGQYLPMVLAVQDRDNTIRKATY